MFTLEAQVLGITHTTSVRRDETGNIVVLTTGGPRRATSVNDAVRIARADMGEFLLPAQRGGRPWGLKVQVGEAGAVYGEWPGFPVPPNGRPDNSLIARIHRRWHDSGPISALENALEIVRAYVGNRGRAAA